MHDPIAALNLSNRHEAALLSSHVASERAIPAVVISGFLGSGKTTLVQHLLRNRGSLQIAVLVNEVGQADIDSMLLNLKQSNAAVGLAAADLSGGCICCSKQDELQGALEMIRTSTRPDCLVFETSGLADPEALALLLSAGGFRLDAIVTVIDVEAALESLALDIAQQQVKIADVVVLNKCDLATLGEVSDLEDRIRSMVPHVASVVRARFGQVPLQLLLDVDTEGSLPHKPMPTETSTAAPASATTAAASDAGFLSHEAPLGATPSYRVAGTGDMAGSGRRRRVPRAEQRQHQLHHEGGSAPQASSGEASKGADQHHGSGAAALHHHHHGSAGAGAPDASDAAHQHHGGSAGSAANMHTHLHRGFHTRSITATACPVPLQGLQAFITQQLLKAPGLLRAKGLVWIQERRSLRFVLHLSGRHRAECCSEGLWDSPPMTKLVFIGSEAAALDALVASITCLSNPAPSGVPSPPGLLGAGMPGTSRGVGSREGAAAPASFASSVPTPAAGSTPAPLVPPAGSNSAAQPLLPRIPIAAPVPGALTTAPRPWDPRLQLLSIQEPLEAPAEGSLHAGGGSSSVIEFTVMNAPLQGISGAEVNAAVMQAVNRPGAGAFLFGSRAAGCIDAVTMMQRTDSVCSLMMALPTAAYQRASPPESKSEHQHDVQALSSQCEVAVVAAAVEEQQGSSMWQEVNKAAEPVLRKAFRHVIHCSCDLVAC